MLAAIVIRCVLALFLLAAGLGLLWFGYEGVLWESSDGSGFRNLTVPAVAAAAALIVSAVIVSPFLPLA